MSFIIFKFIQNESDLYFTYRCFKDISGKRGKILIKKKESTHFKCIYFLKVLHNRNDSYVVCSFIVVHL